MGRAGEGEGGRERFAKKERSTVPGGRTQRDVAVDVEGAVSLVHRELEQALGPDLAACQCDNGGIDPSTFPVRLNSVNTTGERMCKRDNLSKAPTPTHKQQTRQLWSRSTKLTNHIRSLLRPNPLGDAGSNPALASRHIFAIQLDLGGARTYSQHAAGKRVQNEGASSSAMSGNRVAETRSIPVVFKSPIPRNSGACPAVGMMLEVVVFTSAAKTVQMDSANPRINTNGILKGAMALLVPTKQCLAAKT